MDVLILVSCYAEGYYARWAALRKFLLQFLKPEGGGDDRIHVKKQILSLGAGFDTTYFQLQVSVDFIVIACYLPA